MQFRAKELSLLGLAAFVLVWGGISSITLARTVNHRLENEPVHYPKWSDFTTSLIWFGIFMVAHAVSFLLLGPTARKLIHKKPQWTSEVWVAKLERFCSAVFQLGFSSLATYILYSNLRGTSWLPPVLGGTGSTTNCWTDGFPYQFVPEPIRHFYQVFMGYTLAELVGHIIRERKRPDFYELLVHLVVTNVLLIFSYYGNYLRVGSLVLFAHSVSDVFVYLAKALVDTKITGGVLSYLPLLVVYIWARVYVHAVIILRSIWIEAPAMVDIDSSAEDVFYKLTNWNFLSFLLSILLMLHLYWFFVIVKIGLYLLSTGQSRDLQASLSSLNVRTPSGIHHKCPSSEPSEAENESDVKLRKPKSKKQ